MNFPVFIKGSRSRISIAKEIREVSRLRLQYEKSLQSGLMRLFSKVGKAAAQEYREIGDVVESIKPMQTELGQILYAHSTEVLTRFSNRVFESRKLSFQSLINTYYSREQASKVVSITKTTRMIIHAAIINAEREAIGVDRTARMITERTSGAIARARASTIARTETHAAASYANHAAQEFLKLPNQKKRWVSVGDSRTRSHHAAANGQEVGIDEKFVVRFKGQEILMNYPHDGSGGAGNNINCRCLAVYFSDDDEIVADTRDTIKPNSKPTLKLTNIVEQGESASVINATLNEGFTVLSAQVVSKLPKPNRVKAVTEAKEKYFLAKSSFIQTSKSAAVHEYGHHVDRELAKRESINDDPFWSTQGLKEQWKADRKSIGLYRVDKETKMAQLKKIQAELFIMVDKSYTNHRGEKINFSRPEGTAFEGAEALSDIVDSFVGGIFRTQFKAWGHEAAYWRRKGGNQEAEAFANMFDIMNKSPRARKWAEKNIPTLWAAFMRKMEDFNNDT